MEFLTEKTIDTKRLISILKENLKKYNGEELIILEDLLLKFDANDFGLLTPQEAHFLKHNPVKIWTDYLIFRYKFKIYPKEKIVSNFPIYQFLNHSVPRRASRGNPAHLQAGVALVFFLIWL